MKFVFSIAALVPCLVQQPVLGQTKFDLRDICDPIKGQEAIMYFAGLSSDVLYDLAVNEGQTFGDCCRVSGPPTLPTGNFCDFYVKACPSPATGFDGWPRDSADQGTGCSSTPDLGPRNTGTCFFSGTSYTSVWGPINSAMCTASGIDNIAAQLRHAIENNGCCEPKPVDGKCCTNTGVAPWNCFAPEVLSPTTNDIDVECTSQNGGNTCAWNYNNPVCCEKALSDSDPTVAQQACTDPVSGKCCRYTGPIPYNCLSFESLPVGNNRDVYCDAVNGGDSCSWDYSKKKCCKLALNDGFPSPATQKCGVGISGKCCKFKGPPYLGFDCSSLESLPGDVDVACDSYASCEWDYSKGGCCKKAFNDGFPAAAIEKCPKSGKCCRHIPGTAPFNCQAIEGLGFGFNVDQVCDDNPSCSWNYNSKGCCKVALNDGFPNPAVKECNQGISGECCRYIAGQTPFDCLSLENQPLGTDLDVTCDASTSCSWNYSNDKCCERALADGNPSQALLECSLATSGDCCSFTGPVPANCALFETLPPPNDVDVRCETINGGNSCEWNYSNPSCCKRALTDGYPAAAQKQCKSTSGKCCKHNGGTAAPYDCASLDAIIAGTDVDGTCEAISSCSWDYTNKDCCKIALNDGFPGNAQKECLDTEPVSGKCCKYKGDTPFDCSSIESLPMGSDIDGRCNAVNGADSCEWDYTNEECCKIALNDGYPAQAQKECKDEEPTSGKCCKNTGHIPWDCAAIENLGPGADLDGRCRYVLGGQACSWDYSDPECCEKAIADGFGDVQDCSQDGQSGKCCEYTGPTAYNCAFIDTLFGLGADVDLRCQQVFGGSSCSYNYNNPGCCQLAITDGYNSLGVTC